ncbi:ATP-NAD kinase-like domain-containing protein [Phlyctochytrium arcticum]|nr:ATP-NAD kinase-like domain-containing protein [Phlyctochytrium arcticum]
MRSDRPKKFYVLVNPASGSRSGSKILNQHLKPALERSGWIETSYPAINEEYETRKEPTFTVIVTERPGHAREVVRDILLGSKGQVPEILGIVSIGGDGLIHEIINALPAPGQGSPLNHNVRIILYPIPGGTGNALCTSSGILDAEEGIKRVVSSVSSQRVRIFGVWRVHGVEARDEEFLALGFCVTSYALHAQIVKNSEWLRFLGRKRFQVAAAAGIALHTTFHARLSLLSPRVLSRSPSLSNVSRPSEDQSEGVSFNNPNDWEVLDDGWTTINTGTSASSKGENNLINSLPVEGFNYFLVSKLPTLEPGFTPVPHAQVSSTDLDVIILPSHCPKTGPELTKRGDVVQFLTKLPEISERATYVKCKGYTLYPVRQASTFWGKLWGGGNLHDFCLDGEMMTIKEGDGVRVRVLDDNEIANVQVYVASG